jgi:4-amino-4-deoxy-L-arabinose transferase-like glycosyltransferase
MPADTTLSRRQLAERLALCGILAVAAAARLWFLTAGVPHAVGIDEPQVVDRALRILRTGDWNPHVFDYPTLVIYLHAAVAIIRFLWGALSGEWASLDGFSIAAVYGAGRFVAAAIGVATVWLTWRLARDLSSRAVALLAAAQLAVWPLHVRESHYILTDVPMTALTMLALWLAARAGRLHTAPAYAWAGVACGLAAAAKYTGGSVIVAAVATWLLQEWTAPDRGRKAVAMLAGAAIAFLVAAPYTLLDMPAFLDGFAAQFARFAAPSSTAEPPWLTYAKHLSLPSARWTVPVAVAGMVILMWRHRTRRLWSPTILFALLFFYLLSTHSHVFGRYALPLIPVLCIMTAMALVEAIRALRRVPALSGAIASQVLWAVAILLLLWVPTSQTVRWLDDLKRSDTRAMAAEWLKGGALRGSRVGVENSGPTYLDTAGFRVVPSELLIGHPIDWYRQRADYLVISSADLSRYGDYVSAGPTVFQAVPGPQRWGPPILIISLRPTVPAAAPR